METKHKYLRRDLVEEQTIQIEEKEEIIINAVLVKGEYHESFCG